MTVGWGCRVAVGRQVVDAEDGLVSSVEIETEVVEHGPVGGGGAGTLDAEAEGAAGGEDAGYDFAVVEALGEVFLCACHAVGDVGAVGELTVAAPTSVVEEG